MSTEGSRNLPESVSMATRALKASEDSTDVAIYISAGAFHDMAGRFSERAIKGKFNDFKVDKSDLPNIALMGLDGGVLSKYIPLDLPEVTEAFLGTKLYIRVSVEFDYVEIKTHPHDAIEDPSFTFNVTSNGPLLTASNFGGKRLTTSSLLADEDRSLRTKVALEFMQRLIDLVEDRRIKPVERMRAPVAVLALPLL